MDWTLQQLVEHAKKLFPGVPLDKILVKIIRTEDPQEGYNYHVDLKHI